MNIATARKNASAAYIALIESLSGTEAQQTEALAALNVAKRAAVAAGATEHRGNVTIVDGKPYSPSTVTPERWADVMANAARANAAAGVRR